MTTGDAAGANRGAVATAAILATAALGPPLPAAASSGPAEAADACTAGTNGPYRREM